MPEDEPRTLTELRAKALERHKAGALDEARALYGRYLALRPDDGTMWSNVGALLRSAGQHRIARHAQRRAAALEPGSRAVRNNLANILADLGENEEALALRRAHLAEVPDDAQIKAMVGKSLRSLGRYDESITWLTDARAAHPDFIEIGLQLALSQLAKGDYARGFRTYDIRWQSDELTPRRIGKPKWDFGPLDGQRILVLPEQGFGDGIAFARFLPVLRRFNPASVIYYCEKPVARLYDGIDGADVTTPAMPDEAEFDVWVNLMDLAAVHFEASDDVPPPAALATPQDSIERVAPLLKSHADRFRVGVVWTGSMTYRGNAFRSFSHTEFLALTDVPDVQLFSLYKGPGVQAFHADGSSIAIVDLGSTDRDFGDCAAAMEGMDLIITSDTATAHLAGSLGRPVWTLLHSDPFWLWQHEGQRTPWYPTMRLFRQTAPGDWAGVFHRVEGRLRAEVDRWRKERAA